MAATTIENLPPATESKSAKKKRAKGEATSAATTSTVPAAVPNGNVKDGSSVGNAKADSESAQEHPYLRELAKHIRNINKKLGGLQKTDAIVAENPGASLDDLIAAKKINADQKASLLKKPQLKEQLEMYENQITHYRQFENESQARYSKQRDELVASHAAAIDAAKQEAKREATTAAGADMRQKLLVFSQFLRCAAHKRTVEDDAETEESRAFEGALLLVYGGDQKAVDTAISLINGTEEQVPTIEGIELPITYAQIKKTSIEHAPYQAQETWIEQVAEATSASNQAQAVASDPTVAHAGLTELAAPTETIPISEVAHTAAPASNLAGEQWDNNASGADTGGLEESFEIIARPQEEVEVPAPAAAAGGKTSWADETTANVGNTAGESWDRSAATGPIGNTRAVADPAASGPPTAPAGAPVDGDGFHPVAGRNRGARGGRGGEGRGRGRGRGGYHRGDGEFRGRGDGEFRGRGDGEFRGRADGEFRGRGRGNFKGRGNDGEFRGRGGRARGSGGPLRGGNDAAAPPPRPAAAE